MKTFLVAATLLLASPGVLAARFGDLRRPVDLPQDAAGRDAVTCQTVQSPVLGTSQQACLTAGQRMTAAGNAEAAASQKSRSERLLRDARAASGIGQDEPAP